MHVKHFPLIEAIKETQLYEDGDKKDKICYTNYSNIYGVHMQVDEPKI